MSTVTILRIISILFGIGGLTLVIVYSDWQVAFGIFAMLFGNNLERSIMLADNSEEVER